MAYKKLSCCAADLEAAAAHCGDSAAHITAAERAAWNAKADRAECSAHAAPLQDGSVEGAYMLVAEHTHQAGLNYESADLTLLVRNRVLTTTHQDGVLRIRLRYAKGTASFTVAQVYWLLNDGMTPADWVLAYNGATKTARLYVKCATTYSGYVCKVLDSGTNGDVVDMTAWTLYNSTTGDTELPAEADGWATVTSE